MAEEETQMTATDQKEDAGQTSTISSAADFSKVGFLAGLNDVFIKQPIRSKELFMEMCCGCEMSNFYTVNQVDQSTKAITPLFNLSEDSNFCARQCCGAQRPLVLNAHYPEQEDQPPLFMIDKPYRMGCCCCSAETCVGRNYMDVVVGGVVIGSIREKCLCNCHIAYGIHDASGNLMYSLDRCACYCECMQVGFEVLTPDGEETGKKISKIYGGALTEIFTTNDQFLCEFPDGADLATKVLFIAAAMMIEFTQFERKKNNN